MRPLDLTRSDRLALLCAGGWILAALCGRVVGVWAAVGTAGIVLGTAALLLDRKNLLPQLRPTVRAVLTGLGAGALMTAATYLLFPLLSRLIPDMVTQSAALYVTFGEGTLWRTLVILPLVILGEELVWRGVVQNALVPRMGPVAEVLAATALYSLSVLPVGSPLLLVIALGCGLYWSALKAWSNSLLAVLLAHLVWDLFVFVLAPLRP